MENTSPCITENQLQIINECLSMGSGGISLSMGLGKTIISIIVTLNQTLQSGKRILFVVAKTLIGNVITEINKFYGNTLQYEVFHKEFLKTKFDTWSPHPNT